MSIQTEQSLNMMLNVRGGVSEVISQNKLLGQY